MLTYAKLALIGLQILQAVIAWIREKQQMDAGVDKEIARASAAILVETAEGKAIMAQVAGMTEAQVDAALKELEPK